MAIADTGTLVHLPFADRSEYGSNYPEGVAVGHNDVLGDASGGGVAAAISTDSGFLYRLEMLNATKNSTVANNADYVTSHRWATDRSGLGPAAFDLNWVCAASNGGGFQSIRPAIADLQMIRRFPMGRTDNILAYVLCSFNWATNEDTIIYDVDWVFTYWRTTALFRPGFLASFYESPFVPTFR